MRSFKEILHELRLRPTRQIDGIFYSSEINHGRHKLETNIPSELAEFYYEADGGTFFKDVDFEQWGMKIYPFDELEPMNEYTRTWKENLLSSDMIIAEFLGDLDLLIISCDETDYGQVIVAISIYERKNWYFLKMNFIDFLEKYIENEGNKFWQS